MRLLVLTQKVNKEDPVLGFFHGWLREFVRHFESIIVVCLEEGRHDLPANVRVLSLGKEKRRSRMRYILRFYSHIWNNREEYDAVFVHMNEEYLLLGGIFWKMMGKPAYMWRNHYAGSFLTDLAACFTRKVFCTSRFSHTAKYAKTVLMPIGIDTEIFKPEEGVTRARHSLLFVGRITPAKRIDILVEALGILKDRGEFSLTIYGHAGPGDRDYGEQLRARIRTLGLAERISFKGAVPNEQLPPIYSAHEICVNLSRSGMFDKTIMEGAACGTLPLTCSLDLRGQVGDRFIFDENDVSDLAGKIAGLLDLEENERSRESQWWRDFATDRHSLHRLGRRISEEIAQDR